MQKKGMQLATQYYLMGERRIQLATQYFLVGCARNRNRNTACHAVFFFRGGRAQLSVSFTNFRSILAVLRVPPWEPGYRCHLCDKRAKRQCKLPCKSRFVCAHRDWPWTATSSLSGWKELIGRCPRGRNAVFNRKHRLHETGCALFWWGQVAARAACHDERPCGLADVVAAFREFGIDSHTGTAGAGTAGARRRSSVFHASARCRPRIGRGVGKRGTLNSASRVTGKTFQYFFRVFAWSFSSVVDFVVGRIA